ncbi:MAG: YidC/Oxa1 family membrane protein insertase [Bacilli bacterium]|nr:YidC/Oxa1 family membrane protein insertase [Bacilli bacterium]
MKQQNKIMSLLILLTVILCATGCGNSNYIKDQENRVVVNEETGQSLQKNILCKPTEESLYNTYEKYNDQLKVKLEDLPSCSEFQTGAIPYHSLWESLFVKPLAWVILKAGYFLKNFGWAIMIVGLLIRFILFPLSVKTMRQTENMKKANPEIMKIEKKYANRTDSESMMAKSQETMLVYQKYKINPVSGCLLSFVQIPLFFAFLQAINRVPAIFEGELFGMNLGMTPWKGISNGQYLYIILIALIIATTYFSFKHSMNQNGNMGNNEVMKQMDFMFKFMIIMISVASFSLPTALAYYWIVTNGFIVIQNFLVKKILDRDNDNQMKEKSPKEKVEKAKIIKEKKKAGK